MQTIFPRLRKFYGALSLAFLPAIFISHAAIVTIEVGPSATPFQFSPQTANADPGDTIRWVWGGSNSHTTTSLIIPNGAASWDHPINSSSTTFDYVVTVSGTYNYRCTPHQPGMDGVIIVSGSVGVNELSICPAAVFPNPFNNTFKVELDKNTAASFFILTDVHGSILKRERTLISFFSVDTEELKPGLYFFTLYDPNGQKIKTLKLIKEI